MPKEGRDHRLRRIDQKIVGLERRRRFSMTNARKRAAREKFLLGGLVVRAGLAHVDRAFLLGALIEISKTASRSSEYERLRAAGEAAFKKPIGASDQQDDGVDDEWR